MPTNEDATKHPDFDIGGVQRVSHRRNKRSIEMVDPNPKWASSFMLIAQRIQAALGDRALAIEHVGSTSVPHLAAKDNIDVDLVVADPTAEEAYVRDLEGAGFQFLLREPAWYEHRFFGFDEPYASIHVWGPGSPEPARHRIFAKWLREHEDDRRLYEQVKRQAAAASRELGEKMDEYNFRKQAVVREILDRALEADGLFSKTIAEDLNLTSYSPSPFLLTYKNSQIQSP